MGSLLFALGSVTMVGALVSPAAATPDGGPHGQANGYSNNHGDDSAAVATTVAPAADQQAATDTGNGANQDCGAYCPSGVGLPSGNGNGDGNATGKPCAGCVGNADDKNPPGQYKDGSDHNNGYECDGNNGIGKTNPAHTGCQPTTTTVPQTTTTTKVVPCTGSSCDTTTTTQPEQTTTTTVVPCTGDACPTTTTVAPCTGDACSTTTSTAGTNVLGEQFNRPSSSTGALAFTGTALGKLFFVGMAIAMIGIVVMGHRARMAQGSRG
jgi:hypothetical protein